MTSAFDIRRDEGFSLSELIIVLGLIGFLLGGAYALASAIVKGASVNSTQAVFARDSGEPLRICERAIMQSVELEGSACTSQAIQLLTDRAMNAQFQRVRVSATADGHLHYEEWQLNSSKVVVSKRSDILFSEGHVSNLAKGIPLFTYHDANGAVITDPSLIGSDTHSVGFVLSLTSGESSTLASQTVMLRNVQ